MRRFLRRLRDESGQTMMLVVFAIALVSTLAVTLTSLVTSEAQSSGHAASSDSAYQAAEAGIDSYASKLLDDHLYYLHDVTVGESTRVSGSLTVAPNDSADPPTPTPWTGGITWSYPFGQDNWQDLGNGYAYNLEITAPSGSATPQQEAIQIVSTGCRWDSTLQACGSAANDVRRTIQTLLLPSSVANFQMIANSSITYGVGATTNGKIYVNGTLEHDGTASANLYAETAVTGSTNLTSGATEYSPSTSPTIRQVLPDPISFSSFLTSISDIQRAADTAGVDLSQASPPDAWDVVFNSNGTFSAAPCTKIGSSDVSEVAPTCGAATTYPVPTNGAIYSQQTIIIGGTGAAASTVNARVTVTSNNNIVIGNNISYQPGTNSVLGLVALNNMIVACWTPTNLSWSAATIATTGGWTDPWAVFNGYQCQPHGTMTFTGSTATNLSGDMSHLFSSRIYAYDQNLLWLLPPWFPTVDKPYTVLMQREITPA